MSDDVVVLTMEDAAHAQQVLEDLKETAKYLGEPKLIEAQIGGVVMECVVFAPNGWDVCADDVHGVDSEAAR